MGRGGDAIPGADAHPRVPGRVAVVAYGRFVRGDLEGAIELGERALAAAEAMGVDGSGLAERALGERLVLPGRSEDGDGVDGPDARVGARAGSPARLAHALYMKSVAYTSIGDSVRGAHVAGEARAAAAGVRLADGPGPGRVRARAGAGVDRPDEAASHLRLAPTPRRRPATVGSRASR